MREDPVIPEVLLAQFSEFVSRSLGLYFPRGRWHDLVRGAGSCARTFGCRDARTCIEWLMSHPAAKSELERLASHLTVGETYFFRDEPTFAALRGHALPELIQRRESDKHLRIWSAGCCTGEEPYSIAILLGQMTPNLDDWNLTLLATDINPDFLRKAETGQYGEWSFRGTPPWIRQRYFNAAGQGRFNIDAGVRRHVTFSYLNLAEDVYPSLLNSTNAIDIIFCRNVLMYFSQEQTQKVICKLHRCLADDGLLVVSPSEASQRLFTGFTAVNYPGAIFFRKGATRLGRTGADTMQSFKVPDSYGSSLREADTRLPMSRRPMTLRRAAGLSRPVPRDLLREADVLYDQGRYHEVIETLQAVLALNPVNARVMTRLAKTLANQGRLAEALVWCEKAIATDKLDPAAHYLFAIILQEQGQDADTAASLKRALYLDPDFALAHFALGNLARLQGRHQEAQRHFDNAIAALANYSEDDCPPESEGVTAGRLKEIIQAATATETTV
ncbi:MAG: CheR family methyltransferase [Acidiferrobacteraceae bacterium]